MDLTQWLRWADRNFPNTRKYLNCIREKHREKWPHWCLLPSTYWQYIVSAEYQTHKLSLIQVKKANYLAALESWRYSQGIYKFSLPFIKQIIHQVFQDGWQINSFYQLPGWAIYISTPGIFWKNQRLEGFWLHLDYNEQGETLLKMVLNEAFRVKELSVPLDFLYKIKPSYKNNSNLFLLLALGQFVCTSTKNFFNEYNLGHDCKIPKLQFYKGKMMLFPAQYFSIWTHDKERKSKI